MLLRTRDFGFMVLFSFYVKCFTVIALIFSFIM
jgi:hypothetical protein